MYKPSTKYDFDREFSNYVHDNLAIPLIYNQLNWVPIEIEETELNLLDRDEGIDYVFIDQDENEIKCQERFRDAFYSKYTDVTLRYRRDDNPDISRHRSEFYKIEADYLVYGITNGSKLSNRNQTVTGFIKYAVIDLRILFKLIDERKILIGNSNRSYIRDGVLYAGKNNNIDGSSSFVVFDVIMLKRLFGSEGIVLLQDGFY